MNDIYMTQLDQIRSRCHIEDVEVGKPHRLWAGGKTGKTPRIWAPDHTSTQLAFEAAIERAQGDDAAIIAAIVAAMTPVMASQPGRRAVYHLTTGKPLPKGWRVFATCTEPACIEHYGAGPGKEFGAQISKLGWHKHSVARKVASLANGRARSKLDLAMIREIRTSPETGRALARRLNIGEALVSKVRRHGSPAHETVANPWAGLGGRAA